MIYEVGLLSIAFGLFIGVAFSVFELARRYYVSANSDNEVENINNKVYSLENIWLAFAAFIHLLPHYDSVMNRNTSPLATIYDAYSRGDPRLTFQEDSSLQAQSIVAAIVLGVFALIAAYKSSIEANDQNIVRLVYSSLELFVSSAFFLQHFKTYGTEIPDDYFVCGVLVMNLFWIHMTFSLFSSSVGDIMKKMAN